MFNFWEYFGTKNSPKDISQQTIDNLLERIEILESIDREYLGEQKDTGNDVYMRIAKDDSLNISTKSFIFIDMPRETAMKLRDFLVKNFPVESVDVAKEYPKPSGDIRVIDKDTQVKSLAFQDPYTDYYETTQDFGGMPKGTVFYHDTKDSVRGSIGSGCLKLCWTSKGNCQCGVCGDTIVFHATFKDDPMFKLVKAKEVDNV